MKEQHILSPDTFDSITVYDVVVVGSGMAGLAAGLAASQKGASVAIIEKAPKDLRGGHTRYTESFRIPTGDIDLDLDFHVSDYSANEFYQDIMRLSHGKSDPDLASTLTRNAGETFEWLTDLLYEQKFDWQTEPLRTMYGAGRVWHEGEQLVDKLVMACEDLDVDFYYQAEARELYQGTSTAVSGVRVQLDGKQTIFESDAVIIACGGYESNSEKRTRYYGDQFEEMTVRGVRFNTGEAIDMALDIGAKPDGQWSGAHMTVIDAGSPRVEGGQTLVSGYQYGIILNHDGERFLDEGEDIRAHTYAKFGREVFHQKYHEAFVILDSTTNEYVLHTGPTDPIHGKSIEQLVTRLGIEQEEQAVRTLQQYNEACGDNGSINPEILDGQDTEGLSPPKSNWAVPLTDSPLIGYPITGGITFSFGGLGQTVDSEVLDTSENVIPGLFAAGNATGGLFYDNYPGGSGLTNAAVFGKIAGENAADYVCQNN